MSDHVTVAVTGLDCFGYHGVFPEERANGQRFVIDLELTLVDTEATITDHLADTVDYEALTESVVAIVEQSEPVNLLEHLAHRIAERVMTEPLTNAVVVTVRKPEVKLSRPVTETSVTLRRSR